MLLLAILGVAAGAAFALFAWRAPGLPKGGVFAPVSRESALVLNNLFLSAAAATVLLGTLYPLIREAMTGETISVGPPYFNLTFTPLMAVALIILPAGPLLAWKRGDAEGRGPASDPGLWRGGARGPDRPVRVRAHARPWRRRAIGLGVWLIAGALAEWPSASACSGRPAPRCGGG